jgi:hypothetical protein
MSENQIRARVVDDRDGGGGGIAHALTSMGRVKVSGFGGDYLPPTIGGKGAARQRLDHEWLADWIGQS